MDLSGFPSGCARRTPLAVDALGVLSVWWKTSASVSTLFRAVLPQLVPEPIMGYEFHHSFQKLKNLTNKGFAKNRMR